MFWAVLVMALLASARSYPSPCPAVFSYVVAEGRPAGQIQISGFTYGNHTLKLSMTVKVQLPSYFKGKIEMLGQNDLLETITSGGVVLYRVHLPLNRPLPKITAIFFDDQLICSGPPDRPALYVTSIHLRHQFTAEAVAPIMDEPQTQRTVVKCGLPQLELNAMVVEGNTTRRGIWPWLASVRLRREFQYICSGSLVSQSIVVTAAHCVSLGRGETRKPQDFIVQLGVYDRINFDEEDVERTRNVRNVEYPLGRVSYITLFLDITVLVLDKPVTFSQYIIPVCLWSGSTNLKDIVGKSGSVVVRGSDENGKPSTKDLRMLEVPVVSNEMCKASSPEFDVIEDPNDFCAGARDGISGPCNGDTGAGMYFWRNGRWELRGVVSFSLRDNETLRCDLNHYVVYTDAAKFRRWIEYHIEDN